MLRSPFLPAKLSRANADELRALWDIATGTGEFAQLGMEKPALGRRPPLNSYAASMMLGVNVSPKALRRNWRTSEGFTRRWQVGLRPQMVNFIARILIALSKWLADLAARMMGR